MRIEISFSELFHVLNKSAFFLGKKIWIILFISIAISFVSCIAYSFKKTQFIATVSLINENASFGKLGSYLALADLAGFNINTNTGNFYEGQNLSELLKSNQVLIPTLLSKSSSNFFFIVDYLKNNRGININNNYFTASNKFNVSLSKDSLIVDVIEDILEDKLVIEQLDKKTDFLIITLIDCNEVFAKEFLERLINEAIAIQTNYNLRKDQAKIELIQKEVDSTHNLIENTLYESAINNDKNINPIKQKAFTQNQKAQSTQRVTVNYYIELVKNLQLTKNASLKNKPFIQIIDKPKYPLVQNKYSLWKLSIIIFFVSLTTMSCMFLYKFNNSRN